jgi:excisionase family DNA binding protein
MAGRVLLTIAEVSEQTGISTTTLYRWARVGLIPAKRIGTRSVRFDPREIDAWITKSAAPNRRRAS